MADNQLYKQLLERYWQCETSSEEERLLQEFFTNDSVPDELKRYKTLFAWKNQQKAIPAASVQPFVSKKPAIRFYPAMKIAASILIVLTFGIGVYTHYQQEQFMGQLFSESSSDALDARKDSIEVVAKASLQLSPEQMQKEDSLLLTNPKIINPEKE